MALLFEGYEEIEGAEEQIVFILRQSKEDSAIGEIAYSRAMTLAVTAITKVRFAGLEVS